MVSVGQSPAGGRVGYGGGGRMEAGWLYSAGGRGDGLAQATSSLAHGYLQCNVWEQAIKVR